MKFQNQILVQNYQNYKTKHYNFTLSSASDSDYE